MTTDLRSWETRQNEKERQAAFATVERLGLSLAEAEDELAYRRQFFGAARAAVDANRREMMAAHELGARTVHQPGRRLPEAEAVYVGVPPGAVAALTRALIADPGLQIREQEALNAVADVERRTIQTQRTLAHWKTVAAGLAEQTEPVLQTPDSPADSAPAGPSELEVEPAKAATVVASVPELPLPSSPTSSSVSLTIRDRLAGLADRVAAW